MIDAETTARGIVLKDAAELIGGDEDAEGDGRDPGPPPHRPRGATAGGLAADPGQVGDDRDEQVGGPVGGVLERDLVERPVPGGEQREEEARHATQKPNRPAHGEERQGQEDLEQVDELVPVEQNPQGEDGIADHRLHHAGEAVAAVGNEAGVLVDEGLLAAALERHDDQLHAHEVGDPGRRQQHAGARLAVGQDEEEAENHQAEGDVLAHGKGEDREDDGTHRPPRQREVEREPEKERRQRGIVEVVEIRAVQRRIEEVPDRHQAREPGRQVLARHQVERHRRPADEHGLQDQDGLRALVDGVEGSDDIAQVGRVLPDEIAVGAAVGRGLEERPAVQRVPDDVFLQPQIQAAGQDVPVVNHGVVAEEGGVASGGQEDDEEGQEPGGRAALLVAVGERPREKPGPAEHRWGGKGDLQEVLRAEDQDQAEKQKDHLATALPEAPGEHDGQQAGKHRGRQTAGELQDGLAAQLPPLGEQDEGAEQQYRGPGQPGPHGEEPPLARRPVAHHEVVEAARENHLPQAKPQREAREGKHRHAGKREREPRSPLFSEGTVNLPARGGRGPRGLAPRRASGNFLARAHVVLPSLVPPAAADKPGGDGGRGASPAAKLISRATVYSGRRCTSS